MIYIKNTTEFQIPDDTVVSLGKFDGMHRGHGRLMEYLEEKKKSGLKTVIFTFDIPPKQRIEGRSQSKVLTTNEERMQMFARQQTDYLLECPFTPEIMKMEPEAFVEWLVERLHVKSFVVGTDFRFGYNRKGDYRLLKMLADAYGYEVEVVHKVQEDGRDISSKNGKSEPAFGILLFCTGNRGAWKRDWTKPSPYADGQPFARRRKASASLRRIRYTDKHRKQAGK